LEICGEELGVICEVSVGGRLTDISMELEGEEEEDTVTSPVFD
jgi:hypothetical protein